MFNKNKIKRLEEENEYLKEQLLERSKKIDKLRSDISELRHYQKEFVKVQEKQSSIEQLTLFPKEDRKQVTRELYQKKKWTHNSTHCVANTKNNVPQSNFNTIILAH